MFPGTSSSNYIVRMADGGGLFCIYSTPSGGHMRRYEGGRWAKPEVVAPEAKTLSVCTDKSGGLHLLYQDRVGDLFLQRYRGDTWRTKPLAQKKEALPLGQGKVYPLLGDDSLTILNKSDDKLLMRVMDISGKWGNPHNLEDAISGPEYVQPLGPSHALVFYQRPTAGGTDAVLGYREVSPTQYTSFYPIWRPGNGQRIIDASFLATADTLHCLLVVKGLFSSQLVYLRKLDESFRPALVLAEGKDISNCLLVYVGGVLRAFLVSGGQLGYAASEDGGASFSPVVRYTNKFCSIPTKSTYLSHIPMSESRYFIRQVFVDQHNPTDIQLMPDLHEDFYPASTPPAPIPEQLEVYKAQLEQARSELAQKEEEIKRLRLGY